MKARRSKIGNKQVVTPDGTFASKREYERFCELLLLLRCGKIQDLRTQVEFPLIPTIREVVGTYTKGDKAGLPKYGKVIERGVSYVADFVYVDEHGERIVEDAKGFRDTSSATYKIFVMKRKLMLWIHGIKVKEV
jgi:hypothetical protein